MFPKINDFLQSYDRLTEATTRVFHELIDDHLDQLVAPGYRTLGRSGRGMPLLRQSGAPVPGVYGPAKEEWDPYGAERPEY